MSEESVAYRTRGIIMIIVGLIMLAAGIALVAVLIAVIWYGAMLIICGIVSIVIGGALIKKSFTLDPSRVEALDTTRHQQQQSQGPTVITTTGVMGPQYGGAPYSGAYGDAGAPPPAYGQYPGPPAAAGGVGEGDFPPGLGPAGQQGQAGYSYSNPGYTPSGPGFGEPSPYGQPPPYSNYGAPPGKM
ncbi:uncharacterized protein LOC144435620 [Glandiceps talaboti]